MPPPPANPCFRMQRTRLYMQARNARDLRRRRVLERLGLENVGPAPETAPDLKGRLNLITGDNGRGKGFLLDVA